MLIPLNRLLLVLLVASAGCKDEAEKTSTTEIPAIYEKIYGASDMYIEGDYLVVKSNGLPDHKSPYYDNTEWEATLYQSYNGSNGNFQQNPNQIGEQNYTFKIPLNPTKSTSANATALGPIGISLNGVPFYNQYAGPSKPLTNEINSFDQYLGHPDQMYRYHYHVEPLYLTATFGKSQLLGFLLDGFPVYGPEEDGSTITNDDLDAFHGHSHPTADYPNGIYHYHITSDDPYINGSGYYGKPGTVSQ